MTHTRDVTTDGWRVRLDLAEQVLRLDVPEWASAWGDGEEPLSPTLPPGADRFVSAAMLLAKAKQFDDGLYAAAEMAAQAGAGTFPGKASLLTALARSLAEDPAGPNSEAAALLLGSCELGDLPASQPPALAGAVRALVTAFLGDESRSKPLAFYTWTPGLSAIFRQDRLLQTGMEPEAAAAVRRALDRDPATRDTHDAYRRLTARLTNPPAGPSVRPVPGVPEGPDRTDSPGRVSLFPPSRSHEQELVEKLYGDRPIPEGFELLGELIRRVHGGKVQLGPTPASGWYDHQAWSLEPLLLPDRGPEARHLRLSDRYRDHLEQVFRAALALTRETHVKQLEHPVPGMAFGPREPPPPTIRVVPGLTVEPLPTLYLRRSACYRFVRSVLVEAFGAAALGGMRRQTPEGPRDESLADELRAMESLFAGAYRTACSELGLEAASGDGDPEAVSHFAAWSRGVAGDPDVGRDARMMVPVFYDVQRRKTKVWVFLGWQEVSLSVGFEEWPRVVSREPATRPEPVVLLTLLRRWFRRSPAPPAAPRPPDIRFSGETHRLATPVMAEVYVSRLLDRDEFRRHCDRYRTRDEILANLP
jgi:hypothetical protein